MLTAVRTFTATLVLWAIVASAASAQPVPDTCEEGRLPHQARWKICVPPAWNGDLIIFAHGYVPNLPGIGLDFFDTLPDGTPVSTLVQGLGFAYATTSYRQNGLAILEGVATCRSRMSFSTSPRSGPPAAISRRRRFCSDSRS